MHAPVSERPTTPDTAEDAPSARQEALRRELDGRVLVGGEGGDFIAQTLARASDVAGAMERVRALGALSDKDAEPVLGLLSALGVRRGEAYREMLARATSELLRRVPKLPQGTLLSLLDASFPYIGIEELKAVPLTVIAHMSPVPSSYLKQVSRDLNIFRQLPVEVQRQCWLADWHLLRRHASPSMVAYGEEAETVASMMNQEMVLTPLRAEEDWSPSEVVTKKVFDSATTLSRQKVRKESESINRLKKMIGKNQYLYIEIIRLLRVHFANSGDDAACSLRSQLLMAYHDAGETDLCSMDKCHRLAWLMDLCVRDKYLDNHRLHEMGSIIENAVEKAQAAKKEQEAKAKKAGPTRFRLVGFGATAKKDGNESDDGGSISRVHDMHEKKDDRYEQVPGDMGMILQDPPVMHLLLHETIRTLEGVIEAERVPSKEGRLRELTKFICLGLTSQACLQEKVTFVPATPKEILSQFFPILGHLMLSVKLRETEDELEGSISSHATQGGDGNHDTQGQNSNQAAVEGDSNQEMTDLTPEAQERLKALMIWSPAVRKIMLTYVLTCLQQKNVRTATEVLGLAVDVLTDDMIVYEGAFAVTLAKRISKMYARKEIKTGDALWRLAVDGFLIRAVASSPEAHVEVLRLLMDSWTELSVENLAAAVQATLVNSKTSRKQRRKRAKLIVYEYDPVNESEKKRRGSSHNFADSVAEASPSVADKNVAQQFDAFTATMDGIRGAYHLFALKCNLNERNAPVLFDYLSKRMKRDAKNLVDAGDADAGDAEAVDAGVGGYFDDEVDDGSLLEFGLSRDVKSPSVIRDSPLMSPR